MPRAGTHKYRSSLIIGGTGMLGDASRWIADRSEQTVLLSRTVADSPLASHPRITALAADWTQSDKMMRSLDDCVEDWQRIDLALIWMHRTGDDALQQVMQRLSDTTALVVHVQGSQALSTLPKNPPEATPLGTARLITVILGAVRENHASRWLTWEEISTHVISAIRQKQSLIAGTLQGN
ncbi:MAG: short-chain dehydrogenase [Alphaproteobacteria bacterium]